MTEKPIFARSTIDPISMSHPEIPLQAGGCYHIFNHANGPEQLFVQEGNYAYFLRKYAQHISPVADTFAYCLMPNHFHLLVRIKTWEALPAHWDIEAYSPETELRCAHKISKCFGNLFSAYAQAFNKQQHRRGNLFISNFKRKPVTEDWYFARLVHYIHYNAVHHGFHMHPCEWPHSSFMSLLSHRPTRLLREEVLAFFGGRDAFLAAHNLAPEDKMLQLFSEW